MTTEKINELIKAVPDRSFLRLEDTKTIFEYCGLKGETAYGTLFHALNAAFAIGFNRGRNYQKNYQKRHNRHKMQKG